MDLWLELYEPEWKGYSEMQSIIEVSLFVISLSLFVAYFALFNDDSASLLIIYLAKNASVGRSSWKNSK